MHPTLHLAVLLLCVALGMPAHAARQTSQIDAESTWMLHLDFEDLRATALGAHLDRTFVADSVARLHDGIRFKLDEAVRRIHAVTAYGLDVGSAGTRSGVVVIDADRTMTQILEAYLINQEQVVEGIEVKTLPSTTYPLYLVGGDTFVAIHAPGVVVVSKDTAQLERAREVIAGKRPGTPPAAFGIGADQRRAGAYLVGAAGGLNNAAGLPARAAVLRLAESGTLAMSEAGSSTRIDLVLRATDTAQAVRIQKVAQGMLALLELSASDNIDLKEFAAATTTSTRDRDVLLAFALPTARIVGMLGKHKRESADVPAPAKPPTPAQP